MVARSLAVVLSSAIGRFVLHSAARLDFVPLGRVFRRGSCLGDASSTLSLSPAVHDRVVRTPYIYGDSILIATNRKGASRDAVYTPFLVFSFGY